MIFLEEKVLLLNDKKTNIVRFEVWWRTAQGITDDLDTAMEIAKKHNSVMIEAIPVAIDTEGRYEVIQ